MVNGPELWKLILDRFPPGAIIAGGAVRDYLLGVPPKDIDVFIPASAWKLDDSGIGPDPRYGLARIDAVHERKVEYEALTDVNLVSRGTIEGFTVDLVELNYDFDGESLVKTFDFGINRCWFANTSYGVYYTFSAKDDVKNKTVTLFHRDRLERSKRRFESFNKRHGGAYRLVAADGGSI